MNKRDEVLKVTTRMEARLRARGRTGAGLRELIGDVPDHLRDARNTVVEIRNRAGHDESFVAYDTAAFTRAVEALTEYLRLTVNDLPAVPPIVTQGRMDQSMFNVMAINVYLTFNSAVGQLVHHRHMEMWDAGVLEAERKAFKARYSHPDALAMQNEPVTWDFTGLLSSDPAFDPRREALAEMSALTRRMIDRLSTEGENRQYRKELRRLEELGALLSQPCDAPFPYVPQPVADHEATRDGHPAPATGFFASLIRLVKGY